MIGSKNFAMQFRNFSLSTGDIKYLIWSKRGVYRWRRENVAESRSPGPIT